MIVFLIDADNLSSPMWVEEAIQAISPEPSAIAVRRAYGSAENLKGLSESLREWSIRPFLNVYLTKNTTDMALAVDAMELACQAPVPTTMVIGSGDADFVPLVVRLRERGIKVWCVSEHRKLAPEAVKAYDRVILVGQRNPQELPVVKAAAAAEPKLVPATPAAPAAKKTPAAKKAPTAKKTAAPKKAPTAKKAAAKTATSATVIPADQITLAMVLDALPHLRTGEPVHISGVAKALHDKKLLGKNASSARLFKRFPEDFSLTPAKQPNQVRYIGKP